MHVQKTLLSLLLLGTWSLSAFAQEQIALRFDNYLGINTAFLNPAQVAHTPFAWDVNLAEAGVFIENNFGFFEKTSLPFVLRHSDEVELAFELPEGQAAPADVPVFDYFDNNDPKFISSSIHVAGPSLLVQLPGGWSAGLITRFRAMGSDKNIPGPLNYYHFDRTPFFEEIPTSELKFAGMAWAEFGALAAYGWESSSGYHSIGASLRYLAGYEGFIFESFSDVDIVQLPNDEFEVDRADVEYALTTSNSDGENIDLQQNGSGLGIDLGWTYAAQNDKEPYDWKVGVSILDIGSVRFRESSEVHRIQKDDVSLIVQSDYDGVEDLVEATRILSFQTLGDREASLSGDAFSVWMPTALSLQGDVNLGGGVFVAGAWVQGLPLVQPGIERGAMLAVMPRFESRWFGASLPLVLYNYKRFNPGLALRLAFLTVGTDNLLSFLGRQKLTGTDAYFALKINPFRISLGEGSGRSRNGRGGKVKCYKF